MLRAVEHLIFDAQMRIWILALSRIVWAEEASRHTNAPATATSVTLQSAGASFPAKLYQEAMYSYQFVAPEIAVSYTSTGSGKGKCRVKNHTETCSATDTIEPRVVDFAGSDSLLKAAEYADYPDLQMYPTCAGAVVPVYNLPGCNASSPVLVLDTDTLSRIFRSAITMWNDAEIAASNPGISLPAVPIAVVVRADKSGTTEIFKKALAAFEPAFATQIGTSSKPTWAGAAVSFADTNSGVAAKVLAEPYAIGYTVLAEARVLELPQIALHKPGQPSNVYVVASQESVSFALTEKGTDFGNNGDSVERLTVDIGNAQGSLAWPIAGYTYLVMRKETTHFAEGQTCASRLAVVHFWQWFLTSEVASMLADTHGFAILPQSVRLVVLNKMHDQIVCNGKPVYSVPVVNMVMGRGSSTLPSLFNLWSAAFSAANTEVLEYLPETNETKAAMEVLAAPLLVSSTRTPGFAIVRASILRAQEMEQLVMPFAGVATVAVYSLCGALDTACELAGRELRLSVALLADLVEGNINTWGDARLKALNPWLTSASSSVINSPVQLIGEPPTSDTMMMLRAVLMRSTPSLTFAAFQPGGSATVMPTAKRVQAMVINTPLSIGITPLVGSLHRSIRAAAMQTSSGFVAPSAESVSACAKDTAKSTAGDGPFRGVYDLAASSRAECYPLSEAFVLLARSTFSDAECFTEGPLRMASAIRWLYSSRSQSSIEANNLAALAALNSTYIDEQLLVPKCDGHPLLAYDCKPGYVSDQSDPSGCRPCVSKRR